MSNGTENFRYFQISKNKDHLEKLTEIFEMSFQKVSVPFDFEPEFSEILVDETHPMNDLPVIGYPYLRKELLDRQGAITNIASC